MTWLDIINTCHMVGYICHCFLKHMISVCVFIYEYNMDTHQQNSAIWELRMNVWYAWFACRVFGMYTLYSNSGVLCNIAYPSETDIKLKYCEISFVHNIRFINPIILKCCTERDSIAMLCAKFQNDWITEMFVIIWDDLFNNVRF